MKTCEFCQKAYTPARYREEKQRFCSMACVGQYAGTVHRKSAALRHPATQKLCEYCQVPYEPNRYMAEEQRFCSKSCSARGVKRQPTRDSPPTSEKQCEQCRLTFTVARRFCETQRFCSKTCARAAQPARKRLQLTKQCEHCGADYQVDPCFSETRRFCSRDCWRKQWVGPQHPAWKGGTGWYKKQRKPACERCGSAEGRLVVHHRDEDRENNAPDNLETLCTPCHRRQHWLTKKMREQGVTSPEQLTKHRNARHTECGRYPYKMWRKAVLERDGHTCRECGQQECRLDVHHVKPWKGNPDLRYAVENGVTLCFSCHEAKHP